MVMDQKLKWRQGVSQIDLQSQHNFYQNFNKHFFEEIDRLVLRFIWKWKEFRMAKTILEKKSKIGVLTLPDLTLKPQ